jgi:hypothetical protein
MCSSPDFLPVRTKQAVPPEQRKKKTKRVTFNGAVRVWPYLHKNDLTPGEVAGTWYSELENKKIRAECAYTIELYNEGKIHEDSIMWCFRGLEFRTSKGAQSRREAKFLAWDTVLDEQESQFVLGEFDDELIAHRYEAVAAASQDAARAIAMEDAKAAAEQHNHSFVAFAVHKRSEKSGASSSKNTVLATRPRKSILHIAIAMRHGGVSAAA